METIKTVEDPQPKVDAVSVQQPSIIKSVFRAILIETVKDFFGGILQFFKRYVDHYRYCFTYLWHPSLKNKRLSNLDWKENCQQTFELCLLVVFAIIFMVKLDWIPKSSKDMMEMLNNELHEMGIQLIMFLGFAVTYIVSVCFSILSGRLIRLIFEVPISKPESDILFTYLNNILLSFMILITFLFRCSFSMFSLGDNSSDVMVGMWAVLFLILFPIVLLWCIRFGKNNGMETAKIVLFTFVTVLPLSILFSWVTMFLTALLFNI